MIRPISPPRTHADPIDEDRVRNESVRRADELRRVPSPDRALVERSIAFILDKMDRNLAIFTQRFPAPSSVGGVYPAIDNTEWTNGFWTGMLWLAYEVSGAGRYRTAAEIQVSSFRRRVLERDRLDHHDLGFLYTLSCVSAFKLTGSSGARSAALDAARLLLRRFSSGAGIIQAWGDLSDPKQRGRMIIDCNLNLPLLYWAADVSGEEEFAWAADRHLEKAAAFLVRDDTSTFHTFYLDPVTGAPRHGSTHQGFSDDSCWARGQAWGIYGFALGYRHTRNPRLLDLAQRLSNYFLNRVPDDFICSWDLIFTRGEPPRDSSAAAIAACGLLELASFLPLADPVRAVDEAAAWAIVKELATHYQTAADSHENGILRHAVYHMPNKIGVDESCIWGDYFYFEALVRLSRPWNSYW